MIRVDRCFFLGPFGHIRLFVLPFAGNAVVFETRVHAGATGLYVWFDVCLVEVVTDIAVELAVVEITRITFRRTPYLTRAFGITSKRGYARRAINWSVHTIARAIVRACDAVCFQYREV